MNPPWSESRMREIRTSGLMSGIWKRSGLTATAPDLDSTKAEPVAFVESTEPPNSENDCGHRAVYVRSLSAQVHQVTSPSDRSIKESFAFQILRV